MRGTATVQEIMSLLLLGELCYTNTSTPHSAMRPQELAKERIYTQRAARALLSWSVAIHAVCERSHMSDMCRQGLRIRGTEPTDCRSGSCVPVTTVYDFLRTAANQKLSGQNPHKCNIRTEYHWGQRESKAAVFKAENCKSKRDSPTAMIAVWN